MTEDDRHNSQHEYNGKSASQLMHELCHLMLVLAWRFIIWIVRKVAKGLLWCIKAIEKGLERLRIWWNDHDTQEKKAKVIAWTKWAARKTGEYAIIAGKYALRGIVVGLVYAGKGLKMAAKATAKGLVVGAKAAVQGILHMRTTMKRLKRLAAVAWRAIKRWNEKRKRNALCKKIRRRRAYEEFRRNGGMKGLIVRYSNTIKKNITMFMEEDQDESDPEAVTDEEYMEKTLEKGASEGNKGMKIGKSILSHAKDFIE